MTTTIADTLQDGGLSADGKATVRFTPPELRDASDGSGIVVRKIVTAVVDEETGEFTAELDPGVWDVRIKESGRPGVAPFEGRILVPDTGTTLRLWPLIEAYVPPANATVYGVTLDAATDTAIAEFVSGTGPTADVLNATYATHKNLARNPDLLIVGTVTRDGNGAATSAPVVWPDGSPGTYTATTVSTAFPGAVDAYTVTYGSPVTRTYTQPAVTRNADGAATAVPAIVVS